MTEGAAYGWAGFQPSRRRTTGGKRKATEAGPLISAKRIRIGAHADFEMKRRGIRHADVRRLIRSPGQVLPSRKGRQIYQGFLGRARRLLLRVIVKEDSTAYHVVTAYKTSKVAKYWRTP